MGNRSPIGVASSEPIADNITLIPTPEQTNRERTITVE